MFNDEKTKKFNNAIKNQDLKSALLCVSDNFETNYNQELKLFEISNPNTIFQTMNEIVQEGNKISDKFLSLTSIYYNANYYWDIGVGTGRGTVLDKYPYLARCYEERMETPEYCRTLFVEWQKLFDKMINDTVAYRSKHNSADFYRWPHDYEEYVIERPVHTLLNVLFSQVTKEEIFQIIVDCKKYPKVPYGETSLDKRYNEQNSRYYDVQCLASWISENALTLLKNKTEEKISKKIPLVSEGLIQEIKLIYRDLIKDKNLLEPQDLLIVEKLYEQRLPELLEQYENFDHKNYAKLTHKHKNADDLLLSSLNEMHSMFESFNEKLNVKKVENLSFNLRLTKEFIKHNF